MNITCKCDCGASLEATGTGKEVKRDVEAWLQKHSIHAKAGHPQLADTRIEDLSEIKVKYYGNAPVRRFTTA